MTLWQGQSLYSTGMPAAFGTFAAMFTGISECMGSIQELETAGGIMNIWIQSPISPELKIDQSVCHDGICLTVVEIKDNMHRIQAIQETKDKTNIAEWRQGTRVNLERSMPANGRFDGHIVQGHVDGKAKLIQRLETEGQVELFFSHPPEMGITVAKGSVCVNGISLTVVNSAADTFSVALIPYTLNNTNLGTLKKGDTVNIEFDIIGKYLQKLQG